MSDKAVCCRCGFSEDYIIQEQPPPIRSFIRDEEPQEPNFCYDMVRTRNISVIPKNWKRFSFGLFCPECFDKLERFLFNKKPKNLAQELLLLASSKKEFDDNHTKKRFDEICESLKELAKSGKTATIITVPTLMKYKMLDLFKEHGFNVFILPSPPSDDVDFQISWDVINEKGNIF